MAKTKTTFYCQSCGAHSPKWQGQCPSCDEWNTLVEEVVVKPSANDPSWQTGNGASSVAVQAKALSQVDHKEEPRLSCPDIELSRVLGGGIVPGSMVLIGGEPGIGKSTLLLQVALQLSPLKILYVSGEESERQLKMRADRLGKPSESCFVLTETSTQKVFKQIEKVKPQLVVIDSIQTLHSANIDSAAGSVSQIRQSTAELIKFAKETGTPVFLIGHITKEGTIAGPKLLEHMVDTVLQFEGDRHLAYRILRTTKNRFGSTAELGIYEMRGDGLREVSNPSEILLSQREEDLSGVSIGATLEGNRPLLIEVQALVSPAAYGTPQRSTTGYDAKRLNMLLAVLEKRGGFRFGNQDVFLNIAGGLKVADPALDLAVCAALVSSLEEIAISGKIAFAAEVGLGGEVRAVNRIDNRIAEAEKLGFRQIFISKYQTKGLKQSKIQVAAFGRWEEVIRELFG
ncbi:MAG: DNA repair protein RadA [Cyclobacteriaceae bacterium]